MTLAPAGSATQGSMVARYVWPAQPLRGVVVQEDSMDFLSDQRIETIKGWAGGHDKYDCLVGALEFSFFTDGSD